MPTDQVEGKSGDCSSVEGWYLYWYLIDNQQLQWTTAAVMCKDTYYSWERNTI